MTWPPRRPSSADVAFARQWLNRMAATHSEYRQYNILIDFIDWQGHVIAEQRIALEQKEDGRCPPKH